MMRLWLAAAVSTCLGVGALAAKPDVTYSLLSFDDLKGWPEDDHRAALDTFRETCGDLDENDWGPICALAESRPDARPFFELLFRPILIEDGRPGLFTGYFEPELAGSRVRTERYRYPIYRKPPELREGTLWFTRAEIENQQLLAGRGLEIAWVDNPVDVFFLQVQGSGRIRLEDGSTIRVGYGGSNGHKYNSLGKEMVRQGIYEPYQVSAQVIRNWVGRNPQRGAELMRTNPSYVFFREIGDLSEGRGPRGAMNRSITAMRSLAIDPSFVPLGAPVWIEKGGGARLHRLMIAQDTGSAIKGAQRADIFFGTGQEAGRQAGRLNDPGRLVVLLPIDLAYDLVEDSLQ